MTLFLLIVCIFLTSHRYEQSKLRSQRGEEKKIHKSKCSALSDFYFLFPFHRLPPTPPPPSPPPAPLCQCGLCDKTHTHSASNSSLYVYFRAQECNSDQSVKNCLAKIKHSFEFSSIVTGVLSSIGHQDVPNSSFRARRL